MSNIGIRQAVLIAQQAAFNQASPMGKLTPAGYLDYLLNNSAPKIISANVDDGSGYIKDVNVRYRKRAATLESVTSDDCSVQAEPVFYTQTIPSLSFRKKSLYFDWDTIETFQEDALKVQNIGTPATSVMMEVIDAMTNELNGLIGDINNDLLSLQVAAFGVNNVAGNNAARTVNFELTSTTNDLTEGVTKILNDAMENEMRISNTVLVGAGLVNQFYLQQGFKSFDYNGVNTSAANMPKMYYDPYTQSKWGANQFGVFEKDAVSFLNVCKFRGPKTRRLGTSQFFTLTFPIADSLGGTGYRTLEFDVQIKEVDCPNASFTIYGSPTAVGRGYSMDLMCHFSQVNIPSTAYKTTDRLYQNNGTLRYVATNS